MMIGIWEKGIFKDIKLIFPVRGHSLIPNDRDFGIIRRKLRRQERYYTVNEVVDLILNSSQKKDKFSKVRIAKEDFIDYNNWWPKFNKKSCLSDGSYEKDVPKAQTITFAISKYHKFNFNTATTMIVQCKININGLRPDSFCLRNTQLDQELPKEPAYKAKYPSIS